MSGEEEFEVLVSSQDYLKLESRCQELSSLHQKLEQENKQLSMKILQLKGDNANHLKNIAKMTDDIKFLSQKGMEMAKTLINLQAESNHLKVTMVQNELELTKKLKNSVTTQQELEAKIGQLLTQNLTVKENLKQKQKILGVEKMSRHTQISPNIVNVSTMTCLTSEEIKQNQLRNKQLESSAQKLTDKIKLLEDCVCQHQQSIEKLNVNLQKSASELSNQALTCEQLRNDFASQSQLSKILKTELEQAQKELGDKIEKLANLASSNQSLAKLCENKKEENLNLVEQINVKKELVKIMQKDLENSQQLLKIKESQTNQKIGQLTQMLEQIQKTANEKAEQQYQKQSEFNSVISGLKDTINLKVEAEKKSVKEIQQLKKIIQQCQSQGEAIKKKAHEESDIIIKQFEELNKRFYSMQEDLQKQINERALLMQNMKQIEFERDTLKLSMQNLRAQSELKQKQYEQKLCQIQKSSQTRCQESDATKQALERLNNRLNEQLELNGQKEKQFCQQKSQMKKMMTQLQSELQRQVSNKKQLTQKIQALQNQFHSQTKENQTLKVNLNNVKQQLGNETKRFSEAQEKIIQLQQKVSILSKIQAEQAGSIRTLEASKLDIQRNLLQQLEKAKVQVEKVNQQKITMEKEYDQIIQALEADRKGKKSAGMGKTTNDKIKELQKFVQQYFIELACNLTESKLEEADINLIMSEQSKTLIRTVERTIGLFTKDKSKISHSNSLK